MSDLFITILNMSITASYVALVVILVRMFLKKAPKIYSYALWSVVFFRLLFPFSFESALSLMPKNIQSLPSDIIYSQMPTDNNVNNIIHPAEMNINSINNENIVIKIISVIWIIGIFVLLIYSFISYLKLKSYLSTAVLMKENIFETDTIKTPFVFGFVKPRIYIPLGLELKEVEYILKHEQTHIKRGDYIIKLITFITTVIHWFNPLIWISYFLIEKDMEMSCDESVMNNSMKDIRKGYSNTLLSLSIKKGGFLIPLAFGENSIKSRIKNILSYKKPSFWASIGTIIAVVIIIIGFVTNPIKRQHIEKNYAQNILQFKTDYVGDNSKVGNIIENLEFSQMLKSTSFELHTTKQPYEVMINLTTNKKEQNNILSGTSQSNFAKNAILMFSLIGNVDNIIFVVDEGGNDNTFVYTREWANKTIGRDVLELSDSLEEFDTLVNVTSSF